jgi:transcriptional regulator with XRE-family HTH domain
MSPVVFDDVGMSTQSTHALETARVGGHLGEVIRAERRRRGWTLRDLATRTGLSPSHLQWIEAGNPASVQAYAAIAGAFGRRLEIDLVDPRSRSARRPDEDPVHAAMGEVEAARLARPGIGIALDEPYQHFQFAGRGDLVAWSMERGALLHLENRTRFPNVQDAFGAYNAKRRWLANAVAERLGRRTAWQSVTHVMVALWSTEANHTVRLRSASFRAVCPDPVRVFVAWWDALDIPPGVHSTFVAFDPAATGRRDRRRFVGLEDALSGRPRHRDYAATLEALRRLDLA